MRTTAILTVAALSATPALSDDYRISPSIQISYTPAAERPVGFGVAVDYTQPLGSEEKVRAVVGASARMDIYTDGVVNVIVGPLAGAAPVAWGGCDWGEPFLIADLRPGLALRSRGGHGLALGGALSGSPGHALFLTARVNAIVPFTPKNLYPPRADHGAFEDTTMSAGAGGSLYWTGCALGRPLRHDDAHHVLPDASDAPPLESAATWLARAREEHAAVAAFLRLAAELSAVSAPEDLVAAAHRAADEEVAHARLCLQRAADLSGETLHLDELTTRPRDLGDRHDALHTLRVESWEDGVLNEGAAAMLALVEAHTAPDPADRQVQARIAREELGHATLAARIVAWCESQLAA